MTEGSGAGPAPPTPSLAGVLSGVVSELKDKPALLFGIGAGVILVIVLGLTTDLWLVVVVAAVLVLALLAWILNEARERRAAAVARRDEVDARRAQPPQLENLTSSEGAEIGASAAVGVIEADAGTIKNDTNVDGAKIGDNANVGVVRTGGDPPKTS
jgi:hypothetical protein